MLMLSEEELERISRRYPGLKEMVLEVEALQVPACRSCQSPDTAMVQIGLVGRSTALASATSKVKLLPNGADEGKWYCNARAQLFEVTA